MTQPPTREELEQRIRPSAGDIVFAKQVILNEVKDSLAGDTTALIKSVLLAAKAPLLDDRQANDASIDEQVTRCMWLAAARLALAELAGGGLLLPLNSLGSAQRELSISIKTTHYSHGERFNGYDLILATSYRLSGRASNWDLTLLYDSDIYLSSLEAPAMHARVRAAIIEAVDCYRSGLYLAAAVLLGTASEGAWMELATAVAEALDHHTPRRLTEELDRPAPSMEAIQRETHAAVLNHCSDALRSIDVSRSMWNGIFETASYYRSLRNYAVHLKEGIDRLDYATIGTILARARDYFQDVYRLHSAISEPNSGA